VKGRERPRLIERFDGDNNKWVALDFKLPQGIEACIIIPCKAN